ncbi:hypothetical protein NIES2107_14960 [Nostoc carneum NIES-2107]|nr:hypothetical protein NIES2107_14960 [Nostoc carneum NIES-2107]
MLFLKPLPGKDAGILLRLSIVTFHYKFRKRRDYY